VGLIVALLACGGGGSGATGKILAASFTRFDGSAASFDEYRGHPVVVNFFSSTCIPCQTEMPAFERIHQDAGDKVAFLGMNVQDTVTAGESFVEAVGVTWDIGRDPNGAILTDLGGIGLPTTVIRDTDGRGVVTELGALDAGELRHELESRNWL
jgi:thiol-disulfide isomerase/thioredoxin